MRLARLWSPRGHDTGLKRWTDAAGDDAVVRLLNRFAQASAPSPQVADRMHATAMILFRESFAATEPWTEAAAAQPPDRTAASRGEPGARRFGWPRHRMAAAICAVAILTISTVGLTTAESGPGQPFYRLRLGLEAVNLPPPGSNSRLAADLDRADARLDDVTAATERSDWNGAADAADAYRDVVASIGLPDDASSRNAAIARLDAELTRLEELRDDSRPPETAEIDAAAATLAGVLGVPIPEPIPAAGDTPDGPGTPDQGGSDASAQESAEASAPSGSVGSGRTGTGESRQPGGSFRPGELNGRPGAGESEGPDGTNRYGGRPAPSPSDTGGASPSPVGSHWPGRSPGASFFDN